MAMRFCILGSGSEGNSALLCTAGARVLIDAGFSGRKLRQLVHEAGEDLAKVDAVFITHEHGDHVAGVEGLKKFPHIKIFANHATARAVQVKLTHTPDWQHFETGARFRFRDLEIDTFSLPHDAQDPVGYVFASGDDGDLFTPRRSIAWLTDLGHVPHHVHDRIREVDAVAIEANHCPRLLEADIKRPWSTKQRIAGRHGHLSNDGMRELLEAVASPRWRHVLLTHLSRDCNSLDAVEAALINLRRRVGCLFSIVAPGGRTPFIDLA